MSRHLLNPAALIAVFLLATGCFTSRTATSMKVMEYESVEAMSRVAECEQLGPVSAEYSVLLHWPASRKRAAAIRIRDAAYDAGGDAVVMIRNDWGVITDQAQGLAFTCQPRPKVGSTESPGPTPMAAVKREDTAYQPRYTRRLAAVVGVDRYQSWPGLEGAAGDARRLATQLRSMGFDEVVELYDEAATRASILDLLGSKLVQLSQPDDLAVIFFAGHGQTETLRNGEKRGYIIPADSDPAAVFATGISMDTLRDLSNRLPAKHVYFAMDSCYSGLGFLRGISAVPRTQGYIEKMLARRAVQMVTAGGEGEEAAEVGGRGLFTNKLLEALRGNADSDRDGYVTASEIGAYVKPEVSAASGNRQTPQFGTLSGSGEVVFSRK